LRTRKHAWLLALLILRHSRPVDRLWLASTLWPDCEEEAARKNLRNALYELRQALGDQAARLQSPTGVTLSLDLNGVEVDLLAFDAALAKGDTPELLVRLYSGPLLEGCTEEWVSLERERREQEYLGALEALAEAEAASGSVGKAVGHLRLCVGVDPLREGAQRALMGALAASGDYAGSSEVYRAFRLLLHETLQTTPSSETTALYERIRVRARQAADPSKVSQPSPADTRSAASLAEALPPAEPDRLAEPGRHSPRHNLPIPHTSFIGREKEIALVQDLLSRTRLLTLTGSGGCGKTRLSLRVASEVLEPFPDGVWLVELASLAEPALVSQAVASLLDIKEERGISLTQTLTDRLKARNLLLVLDNCEHLVSACAALASAILDACPGVKLLTTSRERLGVSGEQIYRVPSLSFPDAVQSVTVESASGYEAVRLFVERARLIDVDFGLTPETIPVIARICRRLDGIPLAIELAAARVHSLSLDEIHTRLDRRFQLLHGGDRTALPRHQTLRALIDWSYELLSVQERVLLQRLSVFAGGWTLVAAEQVCAGEEVEEWEVLDLLTGLVDKSLVAADTRGTATRYRLLETVRQYAHDRSVESGERLVVRARHRDYFLALAEEGRQKMESEEQAHWLTVLEEEHDNLRQALTFSLEEEEGTGAGLRLGAALVPFWLIRGHLSEGREHLAAVLSRPVWQDHLEARADALSAAGLLAQSQGDYSAARVLLDESLEIYRELGNKNDIAIALNNLSLVAYAQSDYAPARTLLEESLAISRGSGFKRGIALTLSNLGNVTVSQGDHATARTLLEESLAIRRELGDQHSLAMALNSLGGVAYSQGDYSAALALLEESLVIRRELGDKNGIAGSLLTHGLVARYQGDYSAARALLEESLEIYRELGDKRGIGRTLNILGDVAYLQGDYSAAHALQETSLAISRGLGFKRGIAYSLSNLGDVAYVQGDYVAARAQQEESLKIRRELGDKQGIAGSLSAFALLAHQQQDLSAARLWGAATALYEATGLPRSPADQDRYDQQVALARAALGEPAFTAAFEEGRTMSWEQAVAYALGEEIA
jgi:non-specific serine/threonine protein kinase